MSNIYFMCENCGIETNGITFVNGMKFCAKCYHQIFGKDNQQTEITQLKQQLEIQSSVLKQTREKLSKAEHDRDRYRDKIKEQQEQLAKKENMHPLDEKEFQHYCAYKHIEPEIKGCLDRDREREYIKQLTEKQKTIDEINKEFVQAVHDWKALCAKKDKEIEELKTKQELTFMHSKEDYFQRCNLLEEENIKLQFAQTQLAIQKLEKVKEKINKLPITDILDTDYGGFKKIYQTDAMRIIDQQINELKGE